MFLFMLLKIENNFVYILYVDVLNKKDIVEIVKNINIAKRIF